MSANFPPLSLQDIDQVNFGRGEGLIPVIVQHADSGTVLMLGYMNRPALESSFRRQRVVFYSRSKQRLWEKGETSGNFLELGLVHIDCDRDALLITAFPRGPTCHLGNESCFSSAAPSRSGFLLELEEIIDQRLAGRPEGSYTAKLAAAGTRRLAQKVSEEGLEVALAAAAYDDQEIVAESADLIFHLLVLLKSRGLSLTDVTTELRARHAARQSAP